MTIIGSTVFEKNPSDSKGETYNIKDLTPEKAKEIEAEVSRNNNMPATVKNCPYAGLLVANDEQKKVFLGYIDKLSVSDSEKKEMKNALQDIWSRVPNGVTEKDYPVMKKIGKAITDYVEETYWKGKQSVQWMSNAHQNLIGAGVVLVYNNGNYASWQGLQLCYPILQLIQVISQSLYWEKQFQFLKHVIITIITLQQHMD